MTWCSGVDEENRHALEKITVEGQRLRDFAEATGHAVIAALLGDMLEEARVQLQKADRENSSELGTTSASQHPASVDHTEVEATAEVVTAAKRSKAGR